MKRGRTIQYGAALTALLAMPGIWGQSGARADSGPSVMLVSGTAVQTLTPPQSAAGSEVLKQIDDPHTGIRWLLLKGSDHPGGPGILVQASLNQASLSQAEGIQAAGIQAAGQGETRPAMQLAPEATLNLANPAIRSGDHIVVEETTAVSEVRMEGIALGRAQIGQQIAVRLVLGGNVVRAKVTAPGRATLEAEGDLWQ